MHPAGTQGVPLCYATLPVQALPASQAPRWHQSHPPSLVLSAHSLSPAPPAACHPPQKPACITPCQWQHGEARERLGRTRVPPDLPVISSMQVGDPYGKEMSCSVRAVNAKTGLKTTTMGCEMCPRVRQGEGLPPLAPVSASPHWCEPTCSAWYMGTDTMHRQCASFSICGYSAALIPVVIRRLVHFLVPAKGEKPTLLSEVEIIEESLNEGTKKL